MAFMNNFLAMVIFQYSTNVYSVNVILRSRDEFLYLLSVRFTLYLFNNLSIDLNGMVSMQIKWYIEV